MINYVPGIAVLLKLLANNLVKNIIFKNKIIKNY